MKYFLSVFFLILSLSCFSQKVMMKQYDLLPWPQSIDEKNSKFFIDESFTVSFDGNDTKDRVSSASVSFIRRLTNRTGLFIKTGFPIEGQASLNISFEKTSDLSIDDDESYTLEILDDKILLNAATDIGILRGMETLLQLLSYNQNEYYFPGVIIKDSPRFKWRGLMIDASRHFQPVDVIKRNLQAMAAVKMNVFHWHLSDDQGFRVESKTYPKLHEEASDGLYYTHHQIKEVVAFASKLGIRVVPEIDIPGHATAILTAYPNLGSKDDYSYTIERNSGVFDPTLNPILDETYVFIENLFKELTPLFPFEYFHIGGDENEGKHWDENIQIQAFKDENGINSNHELQTYFNIKVENILYKLNKKLMGWDEIMTEQMPTSALIHTWRTENEGLPKGGALISAAQKGYHTVFSNGFYIDRMLPMEKHYLFEPIGDIELSEKERSRILGGEATMWSELVTSFTIDSRIWPRTAAIAERLWSEKEINDLDLLRPRLETVNINLEEFGLTHIKNKNAILRGLTHGQDFSALNDLTKISEPLKMYNRNMGGTEYKTYSPFKLFADACTVDAIDALSFNRAVTEFIKHKDKDELEAIKQMLKKWSLNYVKFTAIEINPKIEPLAPLSYNLSKAAQLLLKALSNDKLSDIEKNELNISIEKLKEPYEDVEIVIYKALKTLNEKIIK